MEAETITERDAQDGGAKRRQVMDGARAAFLNAGFDGASMNDIARAAGVSKGTLYAYFDSKEQLFEALIREDKEQQAERLCAFPMEGGEPAELLSEFGRRLIEMILRPESVAQVRVVIAATARFPQLGRAFYEAGPAYGIRRLSEQLEAMSKRGALSVANPAIAARQFINLCCAEFSKQVLFGVMETPSQEAIEANVDQAVAMFLKVYGPARAAE
ncbi:MAG: TetR/AcrR family transcriptional regulator [Hyphomicrobiales bacterium]|nr:TetR/AcrR family transcriptional regulator [Hyphomicrobiales bacterium]MBV8664528.1 TetR/AcrR family transcriptional regulator [Hyphomicrobiales bacterium]